MKALPSARLTIEDVEIWLRVWARNRRTFLVPISAESDRADAALLLTAQQHKGCVAHWASWRRHPVLLRGWK
jgi:hypothetical protein